MIGCANRRGDEFKIKIHTIIISCVVFPSFLALFLCVQCRSVLKTISHNRRHNHHLRDWSRPGWAPRQPKSGRLICAIILYCVGTRAKLCILCTRIFKCFVFFSHDRFIHLFELGFRIVKVIIWLRRGNNLVSATELFHRGGLYAFTQ